MRLYENCFNGEMKQTKSTVGETKLWLKEIKTMGVGNKTLGRAKLNPTAPATEAVMTHHKESMSGRKILSVPVIQEHRVSTQDSRKRQYIMASQTSCSTKMHKQGNPFLSQRDSRVPFRITTSSNCLRLASGCRFLLRTPFCCDAAS